MSSHSTQVLQPGSLSQGGDGGQSGHRCSSRGIRSAHKHWIQTCHFCSEERMDAVQNSKQVGEFQLLTKTKTTAKYYIANFVVVNSIKGCPATKNLLYSTSSIVIKSQQWINSFNSSCGRFTKQVSVITHLKPTQLAMVARNGNASTPEKTPSIMVSH